MTKSKAQVQRDSRILRREPIKEAKKNEEYQHITSPQSQNDQVPSTHPEHYSSAPIKTTKSVE
ncbi:hypothetical protein M408DRAFT_162662 [Serendipita vermifera MAFF 305830]|uniref:Uncharacterized protein n=1 Tax=Serendipita vermifera MAFF 305830 TaxID=933852 RepID=A0A0C2WN33_SERVB|nr:hypothetical protein M408DRAFT_162662 [Serendipita vermifera MAFF 305830]